MGHGNGRGTGCLGNGDADVAEVFPSRGAEMGQPDRLRSSFPAFSQAGAGGRRTNLVWGFGRLCWLGIIDRGQGTDGVGPAADVAGGNGDGGGGGGVALGNGAGVNDGADRAEAQQTEEEAKLEGHGEVTLMG